jgi:hypothetical protein
MKTSEIILNWLKSINKDLSWLSDKSSIGIWHLENSLKTNIWYMPFLKRILELGCPEK